MNGILCGDIRESFQTRVHLVLFPVELQVCDGDFSFAALSSTPADFASLFRRQREHSHPNAETSATLVVL